jgi:hypothetical protein
VRKDPTIRRRLDEMLIQDREARLIVAYTYDELLYTPQERVTIVDRIKEYFYTRDLFAYDRPLQSDTYFFGRRQTIQSLYGKYKSGENACLFGLRKIGKTSVLLALRRTMHLREEPVVFLDCQATAFHRKRWYEALYYIVDRLVKAVDARSCQRQNARLYDDKNASQAFEDDLLAIRACVQDKPLLLILDEIENITFDISPSDHWANDRDFIFFWQAIRATYQKNPGLLSCVISGVNPKAIETPTIQGYDNPIYRLVTPTYLGFFGVSEVKEMVSSIGAHMGMQFDDEVFTYLTDDYGGHPFLIRQVCSLIHCSLPVYRPVLVTRFYYKEQRDQLGRKLADYIDLVVSVLRERYPDEYQLLEYLAQGDHQTFGYYVDLSHAMIDHLVGYGLIQEASGRYHFRLKSVEEYVKMIATTPKVLTTREEKQREIGIKRNKLEGSMRKAVKLVLKARFGPGARDVFLEVVPSDRRRRLAALNIDEVFEGEIYFRELKDIITKYWADFGKIFGDDREHFLQHTERFEVFMDYINRKRIDAHEKDISEEELSIVLVALQWLQERVTSFLR